MECPACHTANPSGQKFCGTCGRKLESACPSCGATNPPQYKFCGTCGGNLAVSGTILLASTGLITKANPKASALLGYGAEALEGKPFSLFVEREDLVVFFSHWNELRSRSKRQSFEIALKHQEGKSLYLLLDFDLNDHDGEKASEVRVSLNEIADRRKVSAQRQFQEDLLNLIFSTTDTVRTASNRHLEYSIQDALKKLCLITDTDRSFIYTFNRQLKCVEPAYQWCKTTSAEDDPPESKNVPLETIKHAIVRLRKEQVFVVNDVAELTPSERFELLAWHQEEVGAVISHLIYCAKRPIGVIGVSQKSAGRDWDPHCIALVKFLGQLMADKLGVGATESIQTVDVRKQTARPAPPKPELDSKTPKVIDITEKRPWSPTNDDEGSIRRASLHTLTETGAARNPTHPMLIEKLSGRKSTDQQQVFPRDDGLVLLTCPQCGIQESISSDQFENLGNALSVTCPCRKTFTAVLEKRRAFRKAVRLAGHFALAGASDPKGTAESIWGLMVVRDLSKAGLRFSTTKADLLNPGDQLMVRFHLDNSNKALIHKPAQVISVTGNEVGCRFEGDDSYDITLGFYFI